MILGWSGIEVAGRLIGQQHGRFVTIARDGHALLLPA
jgi:hypothetical protein